MKGISECEASESNVRRIQVKDIVKEVKDYLNTYSSAGMDISWYCKTAKEMWNDLILAHEGPSDTRDTKIAALRLKFNAFKSLKGEKVMGTFTRLKCLLNDLKNNGVTIPQAEVNATFDSDSDVEEDQRTSNEFVDVLNAEYHEKALLENHKRFYKRSGRDEGTTRIRAFMAIAEDEPSVGKDDARSGQWVDITMKKTCSKVTLDQLLSKQIPGNIVKALRGKGRTKENNHSKEVLFTKTDVSTSEFAHMITSDSEDYSDIQEPLPPLPKLSGADPSGASKSLISLSDLTANMADLTLNTASKEIKKSSNKVSQTYVIKKRTESKHPAVQNSCPDKNALPSTEQLLLTLMEEVKGIKKQILIPSDTSSSVSQACSSKTPKQKVWYGPCKHCGMRNHLSDDCYSKPKCFTCGSISYTTKEHTKQTVVKKSLNKLKGQSTSKSTPVRTAKMSKTFGECKYCGSNKHHPDDCEFYPRCEVCRSIAHEIADCPKNLRNSRKQRIAIKQSEPTKKSETIYAQIFKGARFKVVFGDDSSGDTEGYGSVNFNGITFTGVAYVNGLKQNLISISQLCDANFKVLFTKTQGTIFNQNDEVVLIAPRRRDVCIIAMSSAEAEYVAAAGCCAQVLWIKSQLADYDILYDKVPIFCDNTSAIVISNNPVLHSRTKHIDIRYHFIRDHILKGDIELHFVPTELQLADIFTKPLAEPSFTRLVAELGMLNIEKQVSDKKKALSDL
ncbi:hypothetical protein Tco_0010204 [Tanacetum coccineum]